MRAGNSSRTCCSKRTWRQEAERALRSFSSRLQRGAGLAKMLCALDYYLDKPAEVILVSAAPGAAKDLEAALHRAFVPNRIFASAVEGDDLEAQAKADESRTAPGCLHAMPRLLMMFRLPGKREPCHSPGELGAPIRLPRTPP